MIRFLCAIVLALMLSPVPGRAQDDTVYVQIEAQATRAAIDASIQRYEIYLSDVNGFQLGNGYYAVALGPYTRAEAGDVLRVLRGEGRIPPNSYIAFPEWFANRFWPAEGGSPLTGAAEPAQTGEAAPQALQAETAPAPAPAPAPAVVQETLAESRQAEAQLTRAERDMLQIALQWAGYYQGRIDGAFGRGTRGSMAAWQRDNGFDQTGVLSTGQRRELLRQYNAVLEGLDLREHADAQAGIAMEMPMGAVAFARYEAPFAFYEPTGDLAARVILISQEGTQDTLFGLYDILQTLAIVPEEGPRERSNSSFTIEGSNSRITSYTQASLEGGQIKGFTLVWPVGDEERRTRLLEMMKASFTRTPGVLPHGAGAGPEQSIDLVSGLQIRKPTSSRSGLFVDEAGTVLTVASAVNTCGHVTIDRNYPAEVVMTDAATGLALLRPTSPLSPLGVAEISTAVPRIQSEIAVSGFPYEGVLGAPSLTWGKLADIRGLGGEETLTRLEVATLAGDAGGPVYDQTGAVIGLLLPAAESGRQLPEGVAFAVNGVTLAEVLTGAGISPRAAQAGAATSPEAITRKASEATVLVSCWE